MAAKATVKAPGSSRGGLIGASKAYAKGIAQSRSRATNNGAATPILTVPTSVRRTYTSNPVVKPTAPTTPTTPSGAAPIASGVPIDLAGLTGDQQQTYINAYSKYMGSIHSLGQQATNAQIADDQSTAAENKGYTANTEAENANAAARGMFQSSIRDGALNDIDATHVMNLNNIGANLQNALNSINSQTGGLNTDWGAEQGLMDWYRIQNSQATPPPVTTPKPTPQPGPITPPGPPPTKGVGRGTARQSNIQPSRGKSRGGLIGIAKARM